MPYDPEKLKQIRENIKAQPRKTIGEQIEEALEKGDTRRAMKLRDRAQTQFNLMVQTGGDFYSSYADIRELYNDYQQLGTKPLIPEI